MATFSSVLDLAHKLFDAHAASADEDAPAPQSTPKKDPTYGLHPGEGQQIKDQHLLDDPNDPSK